jgi:hypothetical protein
MRFAFWISRLTHLKVAAPVAAAARRRGHACVSLHPVGRLCGPKDDAERGVRYDPALKPFNLSVAISDETDAEIHLRDVDWVVAVGLRTAPTIRAYTRASGVKWACLDHVGDNLLYPLEGWQPADAEWDCLTTLAEGPRAFTEGQDHLLPLGRALLQTMRPVGYPELDQLALPGMTREVCREKWNLPREGRIVLFAPAARPANLGRLRRWWWGRQDYPFIARQIRRWCDRHGAFLLTKTRAKHGDPPWLQDISDLSVSDGVYYPFNTLELLVAADVVVGFASALAVEAAAVGRPQLWLHAWPPRRSEWPAYLPLRERYFLQRGGLWNNAGTGQIECFGPRWREFLQRWAVEWPWPVLTEEGLQAMRQATERWAGTLGA